MKFDIEILRESIHDLAEGDSQKEDEALEFLNRYPNMVKRYIEENGWQIKI